MKIENQVCSLEQAKKLKELGVFGETDRMWVVRFDGETFLTHYDSGDVINPQYSAFTSSELGVMLPDTELIRDEDWQYRPFIQYYSHTGKREWKYDNPFTSYKRDRKVLNVTTEAQARAAMLIYLLENNHITAQEVNERLNAA